MRKLCLVIVSIVVWLAGAALVTAQDKVNIGVTFSLKARHFTDDLTDDQVAQLNQMASAAVARTLNAGVGFLNFSTDTTAPLQLAVELDRSDRADKLGEAEFGLFVVLKGPDIPPESESYLVFQTSQNFGNAFSSLDAFSRQIVQTFNDENQRKLVSELLSHVAIADHADFESLTSQWIIPRDRTLLCLGNKSRLVVVGQVPNQAGALRDVDVNALVVTTVNPRNWIFARVKDDPDDPVINLLAAAPADQLKTEKVVVLEYMRCDEALTGVGLAVSSNGGTQ
jgi:hypothetical protein